ncbi:hypothetical protein Efla_000141 [Eimeria flavescens]
MHSPSPQLFPLKERWIRFFTQSAFTTQQQLALPYEATFQQPSAVARASPSSGAALNSSCPVPSFHRLPVSRSNIATLFETCSPPHPQGHRTGINFVAQQHQQPPRLQRPPQVASRAPQQPKPGVACFFCTTADGALANCRALAEAKRLDPSRHNRRPPCNSVKRCPPQCRRCLDLAACPYYTACRSCLFRCPCSFQRPQALNRRSLQPQPSVNHGRTFCLPSNVAAPQHKRAWATIVGVCRALIIKTAADPSFIASALLKAARTYSPWSAADAKVAGTGDNDIVILGLVSCHDTTVAPNAKLSVQALLFLPRSPSTDPATAPSSASSSAYWVYPATYDGNPQHSLTQLARPREPQPTPPPDVKRWSSIEGIGSVRAVWGRQRASDLAASRFTQHKREKPRGRTGRESDSQNWAQFLAELVTIWTGTSRSQLLRPATPRRPREAHRSAWQDKRKAKVDCEWCKESLTLVKIRGRIKRILQSSLKGSFISGRCAKPRAA